MPFILVVPTLTPPVRRLLVFLSLTLCLFACATPTPTALPTVGVTVSAPTIAPTDEATPTTEPTPTIPPATQTPSAPRLVLITEGGAQIESMQAVMQAAAQELGWGYELVVEAAPTVIERAAQTGGTVLVIDGPALTEHARLIAQNWRGNYFIALSPLQGPIESTNLLALEGARWDEVGFLAGMAAGFATETKRVAVVADTTMEGLNYRNGFLHGVRYTCPPCDVKFFEAGDETAGLYTDVVFVAPGEAQAAALTAAAQVGAWVIGAGRDVYATVFGDGATAGAEKVLTSVWLDDSAAVEAAIRNYHAATLGQGFTLTGQHPLSAETGAIVWAAYRTDALNSLDQQEIAVALARLADGSLDTGIDPATGKEK